MRCHYLVSQTWLMYGTDTGMAQRLAQACRSSFAADACAPFPAYLALRPGCFMGLALREVQTL